jgi:hypothetical protein
VYNQPSLKKIYVTEEQFLKEAEENIGQTQKEFEDRDSLLEKELEDHEELEEKRLTQKEINISDLRNMNTGNKCDKIKLKQKAKSRIKIAIRKSRHGLDEEHAKEKKFDDFNGKDKRCAGKKKKFSVVNASTFLYSSEDESYSEPGHLSVKAIPVPVPPVKTVPVVRTTCSSCERKFSCPERFIRHLKKKRSCPVVCPFDSCAYQPSSKEGFYSAYWEKTLSTLANHIRAKHTRETELECHVCGKKLVSIEAHRYHVSQHLNVKKFYCPPCQKFFPVLARKKHQLKYHSSLGTYSCSVCDKLFANDGSLKTHMQVHNGDPAYECAHCPRKFHQKNNLLVHCLRKHKKKTSVN